MSKLYRDAIEADLEVPWQHGGDAAPGKRSMTQGLAPRPILFRVESAEAARELGAAFGPRDRNGVAADAEAVVDRAAGGSGAPLRDDLRERFESSLGADLSGVRVHTGDASAEASAAVGAKAYTVGRDIHFGAGQYQPDDPFGIHLLAHEVAHTVQQAGGTPQRQHKLEVSAPADAAEVEADRAADAMVAGRPASVSGGGLALARKGTEAIGGDTDDAEKLDDNRISNTGSKGKSTVDPGALGYSEVLVTQEVPSQEGASASLAESAGELLPPLSPDLSGIGKLIGKQAHTVGQYEAQAEENHHLQGTRRNAVAQERLSMLYAQREEIAAKFAGYNAWKGLPNAAVMALQRLDAMKSAYGVSDESAMLEAVKKGAENAKKVMAAAQQAKHAGQDSNELQQVEDAIPKEDVQGALGECDTALAELSTAHGAFRSIMLKQEAKKEDEKGEDARKRKAEINALKQEIQTLCSAVDGGIAAINTAPTKLNQMATAVNNAADSAGAKKELAKNASRAQSGHPQHMTVAKDFEEEWGSLTAGPAKSSADKAGQFAPVKSPLASPEAQYDTIPAMPTSVGGLVAAGAGVAMDLAFAQEMHEINVKLNSIAGKVKALQGLGVSMDIDAAISAFKTKLMAFSRAMDTAANKLRKNRTDYVRFGERMDALARKFSSKLDKGQAPGTGEEMYAMIFAVAGQLKEVAAYSSQAGASAGRTGHGGAAAGATNNGAGLGGFTSGSVRSWSAQLRQKRQAAEKEWSGYGEMPMGVEMGAIKDLIAVLAGWERTQGRIEACAAVSAQVDSVLASLRPQ